jgi:hypothetical protein
MHRIRYTLATNWLQEPRCKAMQRTQTPRVVSKLSKFEQVASDPESMRQWKRFQRIILLPERDQRAVIRLINSLTGTATEAHD